MLEQIRYFGNDVSRMLGNKKIRILYIWLSRVFCGILLYRLERGMFVAFGRPYSFIRVILVPVFNLVQAYSNIDIHYKADIKGGILVLHPSVGVVVSGLAVIGRNLTLTGGNVIGAKKGCAYGGIRVGDNCTMGANAVIIGPLHLADNITIGAMACVTRDCTTGNCILTGVPARVADH